MDSEGADGAGAGSIGGCGMASSTAGAGDGQGSQGREADHGTAPERASGTEDGENNTELRASSTRNPDLPSGEMRPEGADGAGDSEVGAEASSKAGTGDGQGSEGEADHGTAPERVPDTDAGAGARSEESQVLSSGGDSLFAYWSQREPAVEEEEEEEATDPPEDGVPEKACRFCGSKSRTTRNYNEELYQCNYDVHPDFADSTRWCSSCCICWRSGRENPSIAKQRKEKRRRLEERLEQGALPPVLAAYKAAGQAAEQNRRGSVEGSSERRATRASGLLDSGSSPVEEAEATGAGATGLLDEEQACRFCGTKSRNTRNFNPELHVCGFDVHPDFAESTRWCSHCRTNWNTGREAPRMTIERKERRRRLEERLEQGPLPPVLAAYKATLLAKGVLHQMTGKHPPPRGARCAAPDMLPEEREHFERCRFCGRSKNTRNYDEKHGCTFALHPQTMHNERWCSSCRTRWGRDKKDAL